MNKKKTIMTLMAACAALVALTHADNLPYITKVFDLHQGSVPTCFRSMPMVTQKPT